MTRKAGVVGALSVIGRYVVDLLEAEDWEVAGLSRRQAEDRGRVRYAAARAASRCRAGRLPLCFRRD